MQHTSNYHLLAVFGLAGSAVASVGESSGELDASNFTLFSAGATGL